VSVRVLAVLAVVAGALVAPAVAGAAVESAERGAVRASLRYERTSDGYGYRDLHLTITRDGAVLYDRAPASRACALPYCLPLGALSPGTGGPSLRVTDLDADGEPEVTFDFSSGGAHCCLWVQVYRLAADGRAYARTEHDFADPGYVLQDLDGDGRPEFRSSDASFAYAFTAFAYSAFPLQVWRFDHGAFHDATGAFRGLVAAESARFGRRYRRLRGRRDGRQLGVVAAWAADEYRLGHRRAMLRRLRAEVRSGRLRGPGNLHGAAYVHDLDAFLRHRGYGRRAGGRGEILAAGAAGPATLASFIRLRK
jgi:hypothetical protein